MKITGKLHSFGVLQIAVDVQQTDGWIAKQIRDVKGVLIECTDDATLSAASELFCATVDIYPHPVNELVAGECTPENYVHALARASATADHLAREVRSSQALIARVKELEDSNHERERTIVNMQGTIDELVRQNSALRVTNDANQISGHAILAKQAEQERLLSIYRTKYHEADRTLQQAHADLAAAQAALAQHPALPPGALEELVNALAGCCWWSLNVNEYRSSYETIREYLTDCASCGSEKPDEELIAAYEASGTLYELQVYERTPVAFMLVKAPSFAVLLDEVRDHKWEHASPGMRND